MRAELTEKKCTCRHCVGIQAALASETCVRCGWFPDCGLLHTSVDCAGFIARVRYFLLKGHRPEYRTDMKPGFYTWDLTMNEPTLRPPWRITFAGIDGALVAQRVPCYWGLYGGLFTRAWLADLIHGAIVDGAEIELLNELIPVWAEHQQDPVIAHWRRHLWPTNA